MTNKDKEWNGIKMEGKRERIEMRNRQREGGREIEREREREREGGRT